jgi:hypothetical protein
MNTIKETLMNTNKTEENKKTKTQHKKIKTDNYSKNEEFIYSLVIKQFLKEHPDLITKQTES